MSAVLPATLYKGPARLIGNRNVEQALIEIDSLTQIDLTIAQRIPAMVSPDSTVGMAPNGRALSVATTVMQANAAGVMTRAVRMMLPARRSRRGTRRRRGWFQYWRHVRGSRDDRGRGHVDAVRADRGAGRVGHRHLRRRRAAGGRMPSVRTSRRGRSPSG